MKYGLRLTIALLPSLIVALLLPRAVCGQQPAANKARGIFVGLPSAFSSTKGEMSVEPNVRINAPDDGKEEGGQPNLTRPISQRVSAPAGPEFIPAPQSPDGGLPPLDAPPLPQGGVYPKLDCENPPSAYGIELPPMVQPILSQEIFTIPHMTGFFTSHNKELGIGHERVEYAPFAIEISQPMNATSIRYNAGYGEEVPDRAEFFWPKSQTIGGKGPKLPERSVDFQDLRFVMEVGAPKFSLTTEFPLRWVNPEFNDNTTGFGDMSIATKAVLYDGSHWQLTQFFKTTMNTGPAQRGLGTGHVSLEPGFLIRYKWSPETYIHSEIRYWIPIAGDPDFAGQIIRYSLGVSHLLYESDCFAVIPTLELVNWAVLDGGETPFPPAPPKPAGDIGVSNLTAGWRFVCDTGGDFGLFEVGVAAEIGISSDHWYDSMLRLDVRWNY